MRISDPETREWAKNFIPTYPSIVLHCLVDESVIPEDTQPIQMLADNPDAIDEKEITLYILVFGRSIHMSPRDPYSNGHWSFLQGMAFPSRS